MSSDGRCPPSWGRVTKPFLRQEEKKSRRSIRESCQQFRRDLVAFEDWTPPFVQPQSKIIWDEF